MKKKTSLLAVFITVFSLCSHAQLKVTNAGHVQIACSDAGSYTTPLAVGGNQLGFAASFKGNSLSSSGLYAEAGVTPFDSWMIGIKGSSYLYDNSLYKVGVYGYALQGANVGMGRSYGVYGVAGNATSGWNFGVCGILGGNNNGAGVYGTTSNLLIGVNGKYAGYFQGQTKIVGSLQVTGSINGMQLASSINTNDCQDITEEANFSDRLQALQTVSYYQTEDISDENIITGDTVCIAPELSLVERQKMEHLHYGIKTEQLKEVFPELVYEQEDGSLGINYVELVPVLVQTINELNTRVNMLEGDAARKSKTTNIRNIQEEQTYLLQNLPNPTSGTTTISYCVPENSNSAELCICELSGKMLKNINLTSGTKSSVTVSTDDLASGVYLYTLIVDGEVCASKRMIVKH